MSDYEPSEAPAPASLPKEGASLPEPVVPGDGLGVLCPAESLSFSVQEEELEPCLEDPDPDASGLEALSPQEEAAADEADEAWAEQWKDQPLAAVPMLEIPFFVPLASKAPAEVLSGVMQISTEIRALGLPLHRLHSDRGKEFCNLRLRDWASQHRIQMTTTTGDNWKSNGRTENWVRLLKRATRTLLVVHACPLDQWSFAMRHVAARMQYAA